MAKSKLQKATGINWKIRLTNPQFLVRAAISIFLPAFTYLGFNWEGMTGWAELGDALWQIISSPVAVGIVLINFLNLIPDPTRSALGDSELVMDRTSPKVPTGTDLMAAQEETPNATMEEQMDEYEAMQEEEKLKK